jgi:flagellar biogenesis protein FliO
MSAADDLAVLGRVTLSLVVVVVLAVLVARVARRAGASGGGAGLRVVDRTGLTREASVAVVEVAGRGLVLGVTSRGVSVLAELTSDELASATATASPDAAGARRIVVESSMPGLQRPPATGSALDPRTWRQAVEALRDMTARRR